MTEPEQQPAKEAKLGIVEVLVHDTVGKVSEALAEKTRKAPDIILIVVGLIGIIALLGWAIWVTINKTQSDATLKHAEYVTVTQAHNSQVVLLLKEQIAQTGMFNQQLLSQLQSVNLLTATVPDDHRRTEAKLDAIVLEFAKDREERRQLLLQQAESSRVFADAISQNTAAILALAKNEASPK